MCFSRLGFGLSLQVPSLDLRRGLGGHGGWDEPGVALVRDGFTFYPITVVNFVPKASVLCCS